MSVDVYTTPVQLHPGTQSAFLVVCDHASNAVPGQFGSLGLSPQELEDHIAWDNGARGVALELADKLECPVALGGVSRLVVDLNRAVGDPTLILAQSDRTIVPGNLSLDAAERAARVARYHEPYHARIDSHLEALLRDGIWPTLISVHSFTPTLEGVARPWPVAVLWKQSREPVAALLDWFVAHGHLVGENAPYDGRIQLGWTLERHALKRNLPHVLFEIRSDEIESAPSQRQWGAVLHRAVVETRFGLDGGEPTR